VFPKTIMTTLIISGLVILPIKLLKISKLFFNPLKSNTQKVPLLNPLLYYTGIIPVGLLSLFYHGGRYKNEIEN
jgi:hypothetical protein